MNKYENIFARAKKSSPDRTVSWLDTAIAALMEDLREATGQPVEFSGPFGLRAEVMVKVGDCYTILTPQFLQGEFRLYYDTGEQTDDYPAGSLGGWNNMNNVIAPLPDSFEEILAVMTRKK